MPIKGLTDKGSIEIGGGLPRIAKLFKGDKRPENGNRPGKDLDWFRVEFEPEYAYLAPVWEEMYGNQPDTFDHVFLAADSVDDAFSTWLEEWSASGLKHRCDGEGQVLWWDEDTKFMMRARIDCEAPACECKRIGRINLIFSQFVDATGVLGYIAVNTHSVHDIIRIYRYLADIERLNGKLTGIPFIFGRVKRSITRPVTEKKANGDYERTGARARTEKSLIYLDIMPEFMKTRLLPSLKAQPALPASLDMEDYGPEDDEDTKMLLDGSAKPRFAKRPERRRIGAPVEVEDEQLTGEWTEPEFKTRLVVEVFKKDARAMNDTLAEMGDVFDPHAESLDSAVKRVRAYINGETAQEANQNVLDGNSETADWVEDVDYDALFKDPGELWHHFPNVEALRETFDYLAEQGELKSEMEIDEMHEIIGGHMEALAEAEAQS